MTAKEMQKRNERAQQLRVIQVKSRVLEISKQEGWPNPFTQETQYSKTLAAKPEFQQLAEWSRRRFLGLVVLVLFAVACYVNLSEAAVTNPPNLVGSWSARVKSVKLNVYQEHLNLTVKITSQQDFRFKGTSIDSQGTLEYFVGVIFDGQVYITYPGQFLTGKIFYIQI